MVKAGLAGSGKTRWRCGTSAELCYRTTNPNAPARKQSGKSIEPEAKIEFKAKTTSKTLVITWAQNATPIHAGFFNSLSAYVAKNNAQLLVIPGRYKNATSRWSASQENEQWWASAITPFLLNQRTALNKNLILLADIHVQPTAATPLSDLESLSHGESGIVGHPKLQLTVIPTPHQRLPKIMTTTGACTVANYTDTKAGAKGAFHHVIGAVIVELEESKTGIFHLRHINARTDGAFCDLDKAYYPDGRVEPAGPYPGLIFGDAHARFADPAVVDGTFGQGGLVDRLNPKTLVFHDLLDAYAVNPHHEGNPFIAVAKRKAGLDNIRREVDYTAEWLVKYAGKRKAVVVQSNHDDMLARWLKRQDWQEDPENAEFYLETALHMVRGAKVGPHGAEIPDPLLYWLKKSIGANIRCLAKNESYCILGIECSLHGHEGPNGARGTIRNLSKLGVKAISGHGHAPGIEGGHTRGGTMTALTAEYTGPISSWLQVHVSIDPMGKRHLHIFVNGRFWK